MTQETKKIIFDIHEKYQRNTTEIKGVLKTHWRIRKSYHHDNWTFTLKLYGKVYEAAVN